MAISPVVMNTFDHHLHHAHPLGQLIPLFPERLALSLYSLPQSIAATVTEIRINLGRSFMIRTVGTDYFLTREGPRTVQQEALVIEKNDINELMGAFTSSSVYAVDDMMREGFLPLPGGHRVGLVGEVRTDGGRVTGFRHVTGINVRVSRSVFSVGRQVLPHLMKTGGTLWSTLILAPPGAGKTTLLRDLIRTLSEGDRTLGVRPHRVSVADERGEIAGGYKGEPGIDLGPRTDVLELAPKRDALPLLLRTMGPEVIATDEIGDPGDTAALMDVIRGGVTVLCTAHADSVEQMAHRPSLQSLWDQHVFDRVVTLSRRLGPGTLERVVRWKKA